MGEGVPERVRRNLHPKPCGELLERGLRRAGQVGHDDLGVGNAATLVLHEQRGAVGVLDDVGAVGHPVDGLAVFHGFHQRRDLGLPLRTTRVSVRAGLSPLGYSHGLPSLLRGALGPRGRIVCQ